MASLRPLLLLLSAVAGCSSPPVGSHAQAVSMGSPAEDGWVARKQGAGWQAEWRTLPNEEGQGRLHLWIVRTTPAMAGGPAELGLRAAASPAPLVSLPGLKLAVDRGCAAINGGFYNADGPLGLVRYEGPHVTLGVEPRGGSGIIYRNGRRVDIVHQREAAEVAGAEVALQSIDRLVTNGRSLISAKASPARDARSAVWIERDGTLGFVAVFSESAIASREGFTVQLDADSSTEGLSLRAFAELLVRPRDRGGLGAWKALNLDGGYSTSMVLGGHGPTWSLVAHRATINALLLCPR